MSLDDQVKDLNAQRLNAWENGKAILDRALAEGRTLSSEESEQYDRISEDITRLDKTRDALVSSERAAKEYETVQEELRRVTTPLERKSAERESTSEMDFFRGNGPRTIEIDLEPAFRAFRAARMGLTGQEFRLISGDSQSASGGSLTIPTEVAARVYQFMTASVAMRRMNTTIINTDGGNPMKFPRVATHGVATQVANSDTAFAGTDPVLGNMQLDSYDAGQLIKVSNDLLEDSGVDILDLVTRQIGRGIGQLTAQWYVSGTGSNQPQGVMGAITGSGTISSGGSLFGLPAGRELEKLIDLQYSVADSYRVNGQASWLTRDLTGAAMRKIRDGAGGTAGQFVWQPSPTVGAIGGQPDTFLGCPVYFDPNVASMASDAKIVAFGDFSAYYIRDVRGFRLDRSDDLAFDKNQVAFRGLLRTDGDVIDTAAINILKQSV